MASPAVEVGAKIPLGDGFAARAFAVGGVSLSTEDDWTTTARFAQAPGGVGTFDTTVPSADVVGRIGLGVQLTHTSGFDVRAEYDGAFGDGFQSHGGLLRLNKRF